MLTVLVLLCKEANSPSLKGSYVRQLPDGWVTNRYNFQVVRLWKESPEPYLNAGIGLVPLAPLTKVSRADLPGVVRRMAGRINAEPRPLADKLWTATYLLMGLRYPDELAIELLEGIQTMRESTTYQAILREGRQEGRIEGERQALLRLGNKHFGPADGATLAAIEAIRDTNRIEALFDRILESNVRDWDDLLRTP